MNVLPIEKQTQIINSLVEGCSVRATARLVGVEHKTVMRMLLRVGERLCPCAYISRGTTFAECIQACE
jgi:IS30 family transposase